MVKAVNADLVSVCMNIAYPFGIGLGFFTDEEKGGFNLMFL